VTITQAIASDKEYIKDLASELDDHPLFDELHDMPYSKASAIVHAAFMLSYVQTKLRENNGQVTNAAKKSGVLRSAFQRMLRMVGEKSDWYRSRIKD
jgi:hypothetical protein